MAVDVTIPEIGESINEGFLAEWLLPDGAAVAAEDHSSCWKPTRSP